jgi:hypothetical protein
MMRKLVASSLVAFVFFGAGRFVGIAYGPERQMVDYAQPQDKPVFNSMILDADDGSNFTETTGIRHFDERNFGVHPRMRARF